MLKVHNLRAIFGSRCRAFFFLPLLIPFFSVWFLECIPQAFSIPLSQVIANDRTHRQRQDGYRQDHPQREEHKDSSDLVSSILQVYQFVCPLYASPWVEIIAFI